jgi:hypothetical protein
VNPGVEVKRGGFQRLSEAGQVFFRLIREHRFPSAPYSSSFIGTEGKHDGLVKSFTCLSL